MILLIIQTHFSQIDHVNGPIESGTQESGMCASVEPNVTSTYHASVTQTITFKRIPR